MSKTTALVMSAVEQALFTRRRTDTRFTATGLVHHSDAGSQYTSIAFTTALVEAGIAPSIGTVGDALDNALMESTIGLYKTELIDRHPRTWTGPGEVETADRRLGPLVQHRTAALLDQLPPADHLRAAVPSDQLPNRGSCVTPQPPAEPGRFSTPTRSSSTAPASSAPCGTGPSRERTRRR